MPGTGQSPGLQSGEVVEGTDFATQKVGIEQVEKAAINKTSTA